MLFIWPAAADESKMNDFSHMDNKFSPLNKLCH